MRFVLYKSCYSKSSVIVYFVIVIIIQNHSFLSKTHENLCSYLLFLLVGVGSRIVKNVYQIFNEYLHRFLYSIASSSFSPISFTIYSVAHLSKRPTCVFYHKWQLLEIAWIHHFSWKKLPPHQLFSFYMIK